MNETLIISLDNELDPDGWALIAPFGEHPKSRVAKINGRMVDQRFLQVLDNDSADKLLDKENSLFRMIKRALVGIPVYLGHPDLTEHSPETLGNAGRKQDAGVIDKVRKGDRGIEAHFVLNQIGASAVENGAKYPSALWLVLPNGETKNGAMVCHPFKLLSVGLTDRPNIRGVESLANAGGAGDQTQNEPDMKLIAGWLIAQGVALANAEAPTESQILDGMKQVLTSKTGEVTTLANEKSTNAGKITTLENERASLTSQVASLANEKTQLTERATVLENAQKTERKLRAGAIVDLAITRGKLTVADRESNITTLCNSADDAAFGKAAEKLLGKATVVKLVTDASSGKILANDGATESADPRDDYASAMADHMKLNPDCGPVAAHNAVMKKFPALAEKLKARGDAQASK
jgi:hypothetical protein